MLTLSAFEFINSAAVLAVIGLALRTESRITRLEAILETLTRKPEA